MIFKVTVVFIKNISIKYLCRMFRRERSARSLPLLVGADLEDRMRRLLRGRTATDTVSVVCRTSIFGGRLFGPPIPAAIASEPPPTTAPAAEEDCSDMEGGEGPIFLGSGYIQCRADRRADSSIIINTFTVAHPTTLSARQFIGSLDTAGNTDTDHNFVATRHNNTNGTKQNITASFDIKTLTCTTCCTSHSIRNTYRSGFTHPLTIIVSDQNCNSHLAGLDTNSLCIKIIRNEDGSLSDNVDLLFEIFGKEGVPAGTVILIGSATDLQNKGSGGFAWDFVQQKTRIENRWPAAKACLMPPVLGNGGPVSLYRYLVECRGWIMSVLGSDPAGLLPVWNCVIQKHCEELAIDSEPGIYTVQFPDSISANPNSKYLHFENCKISPANLVPVDRKANIEIIRALFLELNKNFSCGLGPGVSLERIDDGGKGAKEPTNFIVIGASHMKTVASILANAGNDVTDLAEKSWVLSDSNVEKIVDRLGNAKIDGGTVVIIDPLGNTATKYRQADDSLSLAQKMEGGWHLPGEIVMIGDEQVSDQLKKLKPVLDKIEQCKKIWLPPIPRYFFGGCCGRDSHSVNAKNVDHSEHMLKEHTRIRTQMKTHIIGNTPTHHRKNTRILDIVGTLNTTGTQSHTSQLAAIKEHTARDNVHLTHAGYYKLAAAATREAAAMAKETTEKISSLGGGRPIPYWHGFVVHQGVGKIGGRLNLLGGGSGGSGSGGRGGNRGRGGSSATTRGGRGVRGRPHPYKRQ
jgi:hypothetical protein